VLAAACVGCGERSPRAEEFVPGEDAARAALDASLRAWRDGGAEARVPATGPAVESADGLRTRGRTLLKYDILGPVPADAPRCFAVRLTLGNPTQELRERYVVLGLDPVWVWRHEDFVMLTHWDHRMTAKR
jgi:hypothetical protein